MRRNFGKIFEVLVQFFEVYSLVGNIVNQLWKLFNVTYLT